MNLRAPVNLHGDVHDLDQLVLNQKVSMKMKRGGWMDDRNLVAPNLGEVVSHPFRAPLFRFLKLKLILLTKPVEK
jgi:hypothetical protein